MQMSCKLRFALLALAASGAAGFSPLAAQGITTAAVSGVVTDSVGQPIESAQIQVANQATGVKSYAVTRTNAPFNPNAAANEAMFDSGPFTRHRPGAA